MSPDMPKAQLQATRFGRSVKTGVSTMMERSKALVKRRSQSRLAAGEKGSQPDTMSQHWSVLVADRPVT